MIDVKLERHNGWMWKNHIVPVVTNNHFPKPVLKSSNICVWCVFCGLETSFQKCFGNQIVNTCNRSSNQMATCISPNCDIIAHSHVSYTNRWLVFKIPQFVWLLFFKIAHHEPSTRLFSVTLKNYCTVDIQSCFKSSQQQKTKKTSLLCPVAPLSWFPGILLCRFPCLLFWFFVTSCAHAMHVPLHPSLLLSLCALNACQSSKPILS